MREMTAMGEHPEGINAASHLNRIPGVRIDSDGMIHTEYGSYHPVTGEGLPINAPPAPMQKILQAFIRDGENGGPAKEFDWDAFMSEEFPNA